MLDSSEYDGGDAGVHIHVVTDGDVVVALGGDGHVPLAEEGVDEAVDIACRGSRTAA